MPDYVLKLYRRKPPSDTLGVGIGRLGFAEEEDAAAIAFAKAEYAGHLSDADYAVLLTSDGRLVWEHGSAKR